MERGHEGFFSAVAAKSGICQLCHLSEILVISVRCGLGHLVRLTMFVFEVTSSMLGVERRRMVSGGPDSQITLQNGHSFSEAVRGAVTRLGIGIPVFLHILR